MSKHMQMSGSGTGSSIFSKITEKVSEYKIVLIVACIVIVASVIMYFQKDRFTNILMPDNAADFDLIFFMNPECKWCAKQIEVLQKEGTLGSMTIKDISKEEDKKEAVKYGVKGFPYFISKRNKTASLGFHESTQELLNSLKVPTGSQAQQQAQAQNPGQDTGADAGSIILLTRDGCGWCTKAKEDIASKGGPSAVGVIMFDIGSKEGQEAMKSVGKTSSGVPLFINPKNGKTKTGFAAIEDVKKELA